jgi:hypothetical protein
LIVGCVEALCADVFVVEEAPGDARDLFAGLRDYGEGHLAETKLTARVDYTFIKNLSSFLCLAHMVEFLSQINYIFIERYM